MKTGAAGDEYSHSDPRGYPCRSRVWLLRSGRPQVHDIGRADPLCVPSDLDFE